MIARLLAAVRSRPYTLSGRLALGGVAWLALGALALVLAFDVLLTSVLDGQVDAALRTRARAVATTVRVVAGQVQFTDADLADALDAGTSIYQGTRLLRGVELSAGLRRDLLQRGPATTDRESLAVRYLAEPLLDADGAQVGTVVVSSGLGAGNRTTRIVALAALGFVVVMVTLTFFALRGTLTRALRPVARMGERAAAWSETDLERRFDPAQGPRELRELAATLNGLLERIAAALRHERAFTAELSHELRTPLAHLHAEVDLLADGAGEEPVRREDVEGLRESIARLEALVEAALVPARAGSAGATGLTTARQALADVRAPAGTAATLVLAGDLDAVLAVDADIVARAVGPVVDNAFRFAVAEVRIEVSTAQGRARIEVADDGGRLSPDLTERVFAPGFRGDPDDPHPGAGLGLALARRICRAAGGDVTAAVEAGRTRVTLTFPGL